MPLILYRYAAPVSPLLTGIARNGKGKGWGKGGERDVEGGKGEKGKEEGRWERGHKEWEGRERTWNGTGRKGEGGRGGKGRRGATAPNFNS